MTKATPFSLLLPTYHADDPDHLTRAFESAVDDQVLKPDEVVLVRDGVVPPRLQIVIDQLADRSIVPVRVVALEQNIGLGHALDAGLTACAHEIVARMDADDISLPERFAHADPLRRRGLRPGRKRTARVSPGRGRHRGAAYASARRGRDHDGGRVFMIRSTTRRSSTGGRWSKPSADTRTSRSWRTTGSLPG